MKRIGKSYFKQILSYFILLCLVLICIFGGIVYYGSNKFINTSVITQSESTIEHIGLEFDILIDGYMTAIEQLARDEDVIALLSGKKAASEYKVNHKMFLVNRGNSSGVNIYVVSALRNYGLSTIDAIPKSYTSPYNNDWGVFRKAKAMDAIGIHTNDKGITSNKNAQLSIAHVVKDEKGENCIGFVVIDILRDSIKKLVSSYLDIYHTSIMIIDEYDNIMYHSLGSEFEGIGKLKLEEDIGPISYKKGSVGTTPNGDKVCFKSNVVNYTIIGEISTNLLSSNVRVFKLATLIAVFIVTILCVVFAYLITKNVANPINTLVNSMEKVEQGDLKVQIKVDRDDEIGTLCKTFNRMTVQINRLINDIEEKQKSLRAAEINALQLQVNPHFLYNTLDLIKWNAKLGRMEEVSDITIKLGKLLRNIMKTQDDLVTVRYEVELVEYYVEIQKKRYEDRLSVNMNIEDHILDYNIPKLLLQPIVENAIVHGLENKIGKGLVQISGDERGDYLIFIIEDNGEGMSKEKLMSVRKMKPKGMYNIGLNNVNMRAKMYGDKNCGLKIDSQLGVGTRVELIVKKCGNMEGPKCKDKGWDDDKSSFGGR